MMTRPTIAQWIAHNPLPKSEARMLLQHLTHYTPAQLITHDHEILSHDLMDALHSLVQRRLDGEPMAYILGKREFYGRDFIVSRDTLIPRPETEHLLECALERLPQNGVLWDLGTGSGAIAISAKLERADAQVYASDVNENTLRIAQENARQHHADIHWALGSWFDANHQFKLAHHSVHIIVSNPPYIEQNDIHLTQGDLRFEPIHALTDFADGLNHIRQITQQAAYYLAPNGFLLFEHGYLQGEAVRNLLAQHHFTQIQTQKDLAGLERITLGQAPLIERNWHDTK